MKEQLAGVISTIGAQKVLVEAAHVYVFEKLNNEHLQSAVIGAQLKNMVKELGLGVTSMLFIDDYNLHQPIEPDSYSNTSEQFLEILAQHDFTPEIFAYEAQLAGEAQTWVMGLVAEGYVKCNKKGIFLPLGSDGLLWLAKKEGESYRFTCDALDALCYIKKSQVADLLITVLPQVYKLQQRKTKMLLKKLGYQLAILDVYFDPQGNLEFDFDY